MSGVRYSGQLLALCYFLIPHELDNVAEVAVQRLANFGEDFRANMLVLAQLSKGGGRHTGSQPQIFLFHILINQELPQFIVANSHN